MDNTNTEIIRAQKAESIKCLGKYLNKHIAPGHLYIVEQVPNLMASFLYHITKPMLVFSSKVCGAQLLREAAESEMAFSKRLTRLEKKPIWIDESDNLMALNLYARCQILKTEHDLQIVVIDDYRFLVDDFFQEIPDELRLTMLQSLSEKQGIAIIAQKCPQKEIKEAENKDKPLVFHNKWWDDTPKSERKTGSGSIFDYWEP